MNLEPNSGGGRAVYIETYGCQMNVNDSEIVYGIMAKEGYQKANSIETVRLLSVVRIKYPRLTITTSILFFFVCDVFLYERKILIMFHCLLPLSY